MNETCLKAY